MNDFYNAPAIPANYTLADASAIRAQFASIAGAFDKLPGQRPLQENRSTYAVASGTNTLLVSLPQDIDDYQDGLTLRIVTPNANTGAATINLNAMGAIPVVDRYGTAITVGAFTAGGVSDLTYYNGAFRLMSDSALVSVATAAAVAAAASAVTASSAAGTATTQAGIATTKASEAAASALAAAASASDASGYASSASGSASSAATSAVTAQNAAAASLRATSTTSNTVGTGSKNFTTVATAAFVAGQSLIITSDANPSTQFMKGTVTSYNPTTKALVFNATTNTGSATRTDWTIGLDSGASVSWGSIGGTLSSQTDLQTALNAKAVAGAVGSSGITMATARMLGRTTASTGAPEEISVGAGLSLSAGSLANSLPMVYPGSGLAVSTGTAWGTSKAAPSGTIVGTSDTQTLTDKTLGSGTVYSAGDLRAGVSVSDTGTIAADSPGFRGAPRVTGTTRTLGLTDAGKLIHLSSTCTIPANSATAFPVGTVILLSNNSASAQAVNINTDTLRLAGTATTGNRTIAAYGLATLVKVNTTEWKISGNVS